MFNCRGNKVSQVLSVGSMCWTKSLVRYIATVGFSNVGAPLGAKKIAAEAAPTGQV
jgi:hypothetical protein